VSSLILLLKLNDPLGSANTGIATARTTEVCVALETVEHGWPLVATEPSTAIFAGEQAWLAELVLVAHTDGSLHGIAIDVGPRRQVVALDES
jgi:hypothetical protein